MKAVIIDHPFFHEGAILFEVKGDMVFLVPLEDTFKTGNTFQAWFTGEPYEKEKLYHYLEELREGKHDDSGSCAVGTFKEMIDDIKQANK